jgi:hypothetical protein
MGGFDYRQALEIRQAFGRRGVRYLFIGKSGAILLGYPDTTQDADLYPDKSPENGRSVVAALRDLEFPLDETQEAEIARGKDFEGFPEEIKRPRGPGPDHEVIPESR